MIETEQTTTCLACGRPLTQKGGRGHRQRLYCDDRCRQRAHRKQAKPQEQIQDLETLAARIAELEQEVQQLRRQLDLEGRFRTDTTVRHFKAWRAPYQQSLNSSTGAEG